MINAFSYSPEGQMGGNTVPGLWLLGVNRRLMERQKPGCFIPISRPATPTSGPRQPRRHRGADPGGVRGTGPHDGAQDGAGKSPPPFPAPGWRASPTAATPSWPSVLTPSSTPWPPLSPDLEPAMDTPSASSATSTSTSSARTTPRRPSPWLSTTTTVGQGATGRRRLDEKQRIAHRSQAPARRCSAKPFPAGWGCSFVTASAIVAGPDALRQRRNRGHPATPGG